MQRNDVSAETSYYIYPVILHASLLDAKNSKKFTYRNKGTLTTAKELSAKGAKILLGAVVGGMGARMLDQEIQGTGVAYIDEQKAKFQEHRVGYYFDQRDFAHRSDEEKSTLKIPPQNIIWRTYAELNDTTSLPDEYTELAAQHAATYSEAGARRVKAGAFAYYSKDQYVYVVTEDSPQKIQQQAGIENGVIFRNQKDAVYFATKTLEDGKTMAEHYIANLNSPLRYVKYYADKKRHTYFEEEANNGALDELKNKLELFFAAKGQDVKMKLEENKSEDTRILIVDGKIPAAFFQDNDIDSHTLFLKKDATFLMHELEEIEHEMTAIDKSIQSEFRFFTHKESKADIASQKHAISSTANAESTESPSAQREDEGEEQERKDVGKTNQHP